MISNQLDNAVTERLKQDKRTCAFPGCGRPVTAKDLCIGHYCQEHRGRPLAPLRPKGTKGRPPRSGVARVPLRSYILPRTKAALEVRAKATRTSLARAAADVLDETLDDS